MISQKKIKQIQSLKTKKGRTIEGLFLIEGLRCIKSTPAVLISSAVLSGWDRLLHLDILPA